MLPSLVSFSGYPSAGKDAAADLLVSRARYAKTYMTKPLEQALLRVDPWIVDHKENTIERFSDLHENLGFDATRNFEEVRRLLGVGSYFGQSLLGLNVWNNLVFDEIQTLQGLGKSVALSGVGHPKELSLVRECGGVSVWINRDTARAPKSLPMLITPEDCDIVVDNNGTLRELYIKLIIAFEEYTEKEDEENEDNTEDTLVIASKNEESNDVG